MTTGHRDLANELIRETYRSKSRLPAMTNRPAVALRRALVSAKRFVADESMSSFMAYLATVPFKMASQRWDDILASLRHTAKLPFPSMFIEYDAHAFKRGLMLVEDNNPHDAWGIRLEEVPMDEVVPRIAWLFEQDARDENLIWMQVFTSDPTLALPLRYAYRTDDRGFDPRLGIDTRPNMVMHGLIGADDCNIGVQYAVPLDKTPKFRVPVHHGGRFAYETHKLLVEFGSDMRYALTLLATLNDIPKIEVQVRPAKSYLGGGQIRKYLDYTTLRLTLPVRGTTLTLAKRLIAKARRGWHEVRAHWRINHPRLDGKYCARREDHLWLEADERGHAHCKLCDARRVWIVLPTGRGDPAISVRTHKYALHH